MKMVIDDDDHDVFLVKNNERLRKYKHIKSNS